MSYLETLKYLAQLEVFGVQPGLDRLRVVLDRLANPERRFLALHIAGTNGKGSTAAFSAALLVQAALTESRPAKVRIGLYTSPHLARVRERIQISEPDSASLRECSESEFSAAIDAVREAAAIEPAVTVTFFEVLTAAAFLYFAQQGVEVAVIETGLGGRLDATRLCEPGATIVTGISWDHIEILGPTLVDIAGEKAGIFRTGVPAIVACDDPQALARLRDEAQKIGAPLQIYGNDVNSVPRLRTEQRLALPLLGTHQERNAALALAGVTRLPHRLARIAMQPEVQLAGLAAVSWPGRLERLWPSSDRGANSATLASRLTVAPPTHGEVIVDAAHNPEGSEALRHFLDAHLLGRRLTVLFGVVIGKAVAGMLEPLRLATEVVLTRPPSPRGRNATSLYDELRDELASAEVTVQESWQEALQTALRHTEQDGVLLVYGSIFLMGAVRALWLGEIVDPLGVQDPAAVRRDATAKPEKSV